MATRSRSSVLPRAGVDTAAPSPTGTAAAVATRHRDQEPSGAPAVARRIVKVTSSDPGLPLGILVLVVVFLVLQNRIDRKDPKLTGLPPQVDLDFGPPATGTPPAAAP